MQFGTNVTYMLIAPWLVLSFIIFYMHKKKFSFHFNYLWKVHLPVQLCHANLAKKNYLLIPGQ